MKCGQKWSKGFTIVETLMFLAVTSALLISALTVVSGAQNKTEFSQAVNEFNQQINLVMNNVANGYYANAGNFAGDKSCTVDVGTGELAFGASGSGTGQGTSNDCIFSGRAIQFKAGSDYFVYNLAAKRVSTDPATLEKIEVQSFADAKMRVIEKDPVTSRTDWPSTTEKVRIKNGLTVEKVRYKSAGVAVDSAGVAFYGGLAGYSAGNLSNGARQVDFSPIPGQNLTNTQTEYVTAFEKYADGVSPYSDPDNLDKTKNPASGVWICLDSGGTNQHATVLIGGEGSQNSTKLAIKDGKCAGDDI